MMRSMSSLRSLMSSPRRAMFSAAVLTVALADSKFLTTFAHDLGIDAADNGVDPLQRFIGAVGEPHHRLHRTVDNWP